MNHRIPIIEEYGGHSGEWRSMIQPAPKKQLITPTSSDMLGYYPRSNHSQLIQARSSSKPRMPVSSLISYWITPTFPTLTIITES
jgi:hypothetical protein